MQPLRTCPKGDVLSQSILCPMNNAWLVTAESRSSFSKAWQDIHDPRPESRESCLLTNSCLIISLPVLQAVFLLVHCWTRHWLKFLVLRGRRKSGSVLYGIAKFSIVDVCYSFAVLYSFFTRNLWECRVAIWQSSINVSYWNRRETENQLVSDDCIIKMDRMLGSHSYTLFFLPFIHHRPTRMVLRTSGLEFWKLDAIRDQNVRKTQEK